MQAMSSNNSEFTRKESKYVILENSFEEITELVNDHIPISIFKGNAPISFIETTYLDTRDHLLFHEYLQSRPFRFKIRMRRYGDSGGFEDQYHVELKVKYSGVSIKRRFILPAAYLKDFLKCKDLKKEIKEANKGLSGTQKSYKIISKLISLNNLQPVLRTRYERIAFQKKTGRIRVTVDRNIVHEKINGATKLDNLDAIILESKIMGTTPKWHKKLVNRLSLLQQQRFSKYATGMNSMYYPSRGKYNFSAEGIEQTEMPESIRQSFELLCSRLKLEPGAMEN